ncbi:hypothetical protein G6F47_008389 [Rhizopus delemar]|nr:hypothetical protein G6F53_008136 [Rhizopus delemar]KAG1558225.1 hypothetical protein G6F49_004695 [Rhizopus delemar]KAG1583791.1 hypothetical protein G6F48_008303 [Rhizopus delemar]KAG1595853.1 hypothetical protein G6F47_008389 [Rhizopus delemar]KAG1639213.1 hypothetical protein G6F44_008055 [Rhizopus delemar]
MVLSPKVSKPPEHVHQRPAVTRESLLHRHSHVSSQSSSDSVDLNTTDSNNVQPVIIDTTYWGVSQSSGSIFFDVTSRRESDRELYKVAFYQLKEYVGLIVHKSGPNRYLEVNFDNEEFRTSACHEGLKFDNGLVIIRPRLLEGLRSTLGNYGVVRDVGIVTDTETGAFLGSGYAVLDYSPDPTQTDPFLELTHATEWPGHIRTQCPDKFALGKRRKGNHSPSVSHELAPPVNTVTNDNTALDTTALAVFNTEVSQYATNVTLDGTLTNNSSDSKDSIQSFTVYRQHATDPLFEQSNLSQYANVDKTPNENTSHTLVEEKGLPTRPASPSDLNPTQEFMDLSSDEDLLDTHTSTAQPIRKSNRLPKPRQAHTLLSLNGNSLFKLSSPTSRKHLIRYIRSKPPTFVALQEIDNSGSNIHHLQLLHQQFCSHQSFWTRYCGLLCFDPQYTLTGIPLPEDAHCILAKITHINDQMAPFYILVVYAPASLPRDKFEFFDFLLSYRQLSPYDSDSCVNRMIIAGDFNYSLPSPSSINRAPPPPRWLHFPQYHFQNVMVDLRSLDTPTFRRGPYTQSTIDFIYVDMSVNYVDANVEFLNASGTDHTLLQVTLKADFLFDTGPGIWRANSLYVDIKEYRQQLATILNALYDKEIEHSSSTPQELWDLVKSRVQLFTRRFRRKLVDWRKQQIVALQKKNQRILRGSLPTPLLAIHLPRVESQIQALQQEITSIAILKAEHIWRERGETDAGCLKKSAEQRRVQRSIPPLRSPLTQNIYAICSSALNDMISNILASCRLFMEDSDMMVSPFVKEEILDQVTRTPKNWRTITLINCDAKIFTRMLNSRLGSVVSSLIPPWQSGFMKDRFIASNGILINLAIEQAAVRNSDEIGLLCAQEKSYDRIHPDYLCTVLDQYGFPASFVSSIDKLFFGVSMRVDVNAFLTTPVPLGWGLRQDDPISPLLFNLAIESLIKAIVDSPRIIGFCPPNLSLAEHTHTSI